MAIVLGLHYILEADSSFVVTFSTCCPALSTRNLRTLFLQSRLCRKGQKTNCLLSSC